ALIENDAVEQVTQQLPLPDDVLIPPVAFYRIDDGSSLRGKWIEHAGKCGECRAVVTVVNHHGPAAQVQDIETPRQTLRIAAERGDSCADDFCGSIQSPHRRNGG